MHLNTSFVYVLIDSGPLTGRFRDKSGKHGQFINDALTADSQRIVVNFPAVRDKLLPIVDGNSAAVRHFP